MGANISLEKILDKFIKIGEQPYPVPEHRKMLSSKQYVNLALDTLENLPFYPLLTDISIKYINENRKMTD